MNWLDVVLLVIVVGSVIASFRKGLTHELIGLASVVLGLLFGAWFYGTAAGYLSHYITSRHAANLVGFLLVFCSVMILGGLVGWVVGKFLRVTGLSFFDHILGAAFGAVRGALVAVAILMAAMAFTPSDNPPQAVVHSTLAPYVASASRVFVEIAPKELKDGFHKTYAQVREAWAQALKHGTHIAPDSEKAKNEKRI